MKDAPITYETFLENKKVEAKLGGLAVAPPLNEKLFPHQNDICHWAIRGGQRAIFAAFGLGKTAMQLQLIVSMCQATEDCGLIVAPLGVRQEFRRDAKTIFGVDIQYVRTDAEFHELYEAGHRHFLTNYERIREGMLSTKHFTVISLDEASVLRSRGSKTYQEFLDKCRNVKYKYVATATPAPNDYKEIIHYADFLGIMDSGQALTRFFKRNSSQAGNLTLHPHKEEEFWRWVGTWACFVQYPSDLGHSDEGYLLPELQLEKNIIPHRLTVDHADAGTDGWGQGKIFADKAVGLTEQSKERRRSLEQRCEKAIELIEGSSDDHFAIWCELNDEAAVMEAYLRERFGKDAYVSAHGVSKLSDIDQREADLVKFSEGLCQFIVTKPSVSGSGCNFQRNCHRALYLNVTDKFNDFIQSVHRIYRFLQKEDVRIDIIYTESQDRTFDNMMRKWKQYDELNANMREIIRKYGLNVSVDEVVRRSMGVQRVEIKGKYFTAAHNDNVLEMRDHIKENSVDLIVTSWPFSDQYEYTPSFNDFGHNDGDEAFFAQMDFLTPNEYRALKPGRRYCLHVKDRIVFGYQNPYGREQPIGRYSVNPFSDKCVQHMVKHGFVYDGRIIVDTDVVRENSQTNRLGWSEMSKDGSKMGVGMPEYILLFYKPQSDISKGYADTPVTHSRNGLWYKCACGAEGDNYIREGSKKPHPFHDQGGVITCRACNKRTVKKIYREEYSRGRWQTDASKLWRSSGDRFLTSDQIMGLDPKKLVKLWEIHSKKALYSHEEHVRVLEALDKKGQLPSGFMLLHPHLANINIWEDIIRVHTLNTKQSQQRKEMHTCPLQFDVVDRLITRYSNEGELVLDPFGGIMTVPYRAVKLGRRGYGIELNPEYFADGVRHLRHMEHKLSVPTLWDLAELDTADEQVESLELEAA